MVLVDYCKAFDMVDHGLLLDKLKLYGVGGETIKWLQSYLADRHQLVYLGGCVSDMVLMKHGVPQGSILGPLFFTVFINDLSLHVGSSEIDLYANDIKNDTWARVDMEFLFECLTFCCSFINLTEWHQRRVTCQQLIGYINIRRKISYFSTCVVTAFLRAGNPCITPQFM